MQINQKTNRLLVYILMAAIPILSSYIGVAGQDDIKTRSGPIPCSRLEKSHDFLFITYERRLRHADSGQNTVLLRLHNNSSCSVMITAGSAEKFRKPLPKNPTMIQRIQREINYDLPNDVLVPELQYKYNAEGRERNGIGGDTFFGFYLLPKHSILFEVAMKHLGELGVGNMIAVPFQYQWEAEDQSGNIYPSVESRVLFWSDSLPSELKKRIKSELVKND